MNWILLKRDLHAVSVFDRGLGEHFDAPLPAYMAKQPGDFYGWRSAQQIAKALQAVHEPHVPAGQCLPPLITSVKPHVPP